MKCCTANSNIENRFVPLFRKCRCKCEKFILWENFMEKQNDKRKKRHKKNKIVLTANERKRQQTACRRKWRKQSINVLQSYCARGAVAAEYSIANDNGSEMQSFNSGSWFCVQQICSNVWVFVIRAQKREDDAFGRRTNAAAIACRLSKKMSLMSLWQI